jgi:S-ribosylhomocysteine lyase LuxS involved in autoinducer biosynthesis
MEDWQAMKEVVAAVRQAIPDAAQRPAGEVLEHVLVALRQAEAKTIEQTYAENPSADESKR